MDFFKEADLDFFLKIQGTKYKAGDPNDAQTSQQLKSTIYAKTDHWRNLIAEKGYITYFKKHWQNAGNYRGYSWAKIFLPEYEKAQIYFTVGASADRHNGNTCLFIKIDCQKKDGLSSYQIHLFNQYLEKNCPDAKWQFIGKNDLSNHSWQTLENQTLDFIQKNTIHYKALAELLWPSGVGIELKLARLCWNDLGWKKPSGPNGKSKSTGKAQEKEKGYGFEEWLFDIDRQIEGYHYGFIQALNKGNHKGKTYDISLYASHYNEETKKPSWYWVGRIHRLEVLTDDQKKSALDTYKRNSWLSQMELDLKEINIETLDYQYVAKEDILNVRFKVHEDHFTLLEAPVLIDDFENEVSGSKHYVLVAPKEGYNLTENTTGKYKFKSGHNKTKTGTSTSTYTSRTIQRNLLHKKIQEKVHVQLTRAYEGTQKEVGTEVSTGRGTSIDLVVHHPEEGDTFYEIKTGHSALEGIREALGQLLEYAFYPKENLAKKLIIVTPHIASKEVREYMKHLRKTFGIDLHYQRYCSEKELLEDAVY